MLRFQWLVFIVLMSWNCEFRTVWCYPHGVTEDACGTMMPGHGVPEQTSPFPYALQISNQQISGGESITVNLSLDATVQSQYGYFLGFFIRVADVNANDTTALGQFGSFEHGVIGYCDCFGLLQSTISHDNNVTKTSITAQWTAPYFNGDIVFLVSVVFDYNTFWAKRVGATATLSFEGPTPPPPTTTPTPLVTNFDYSVCGVSQSCFGFPDKCVDSQTCTMIVSYYGESDKLHVNMAAATVGYIAVGFSKDTGMGDDSVIQCMIPDQSGASINIGHDNYPAIDDSSFTLESIDYSAGTLKCSVTRPVNSTVTSNYGSVSNNLDASHYYLLMAMGYTNSTGNGIVVHEERTFTPLSLDLMSTEYVIIDSDSTPTIQFDYSVCGVTQSCFGNLPKCIERKSCTMLVSYCPDSDGKTLHMTLASSSPGYVALGLSKDTLMGDDSVIECMLTDPSNYINVAASVNDDHTNHKATGNMSYYFNVESTSYVDQTLTCKVSREITTTVKSSAKDITTDVQANNYYLLLVKGTLNADQTDISGHNTIVVSVDAVNLMSTDFIIIGDQTKPNVNVVIHGSLMVVAWIGTVSIAIFMARFYKDMWPEQMWCKVKIWFAIHRALNVITVLLTMAAFILIFVYKKGFSSVWKDNAHPIIGTITMAFAIIQPFGSLFRCAPGDPHRPIFNWLHFCLGNTTCILALATIFLAVNLKATFLPKYFWWILVGFIVFYVLMYGIMEYYVRMGQKKKKINDIALTDRKGSDEPGMLKKKSSSSSLFKSVMLGIFLCGVTGFTVALVTVICTAKASS